LGAGSDGGGNGATVTAGAGGVTVAAGGVVGLEQAVSTKPISITIDRRMSRLNSLSNRLIIPAIISAPDGYFLGAGLGRGPTPTPVFPPPDGPLSVPALGGRLVPPLARTLVQALPKHSVQSSPWLAQQ
jgi:hypothetical protein